MNLKDFKRDMELETGVKMTTAQARALRSVINEHRAEALAGGARPEVGEPGYSAWYEAQLTPADKAAMAAVDAYEATPWEEPDYDRCICSEADDEAHPNCPDHGVVAAESHKHEGIMANGHFWKRV